MRIGLSSSSYLPSPCSELHLLPAFRNSCSVRTGTLLMFPPSNYKIAYVKTEALGDEKSLEIQNIDFIVKAKKQRKLSVELKSYAAPLQLESCSKQYDYHDNSGPWT